MDRNNVVRDLLAVYALSCALFLTGVLAEPTSAAVAMQSPESTLAVTSTIVDEPQYVSTVADIDAGNIQTLATASSEDIAVPMGFFEQIGSFVYSLAANVSGGFGVIAEGLTATVNQTAVTNSTFAITSQTYPETWAKASNHYVTWTVPTYPQLAPNTARKSEVRPYLISSTATSTAKKIFVGMAAPVTKGKTLVNVTRLNQQVPPGTYYVRLELTDTITSTAERTEQQIRNFPLNPVLSTVVSSSTSSQIVTVIPHADPFIAITAPTSTTSWKSGTIQRVTWTSNFVKGAYDVKGSIYAGIHVVPRYGYDTNSNSVQLQQLTVEDVATLKSLSAKDRVVLDGRTPDQLTDLDATKIDAIPGLSADGKTKLKSLSDGGLAALPVISFRTLDEMTIGGSLKSVNDPTSLLTLATADMSPKGVIAGTLTGGVSNIGVLVNTVGNIVHVDLAKYDPLLGLIAGLFDSIFGSDDKKPEVVNATLYLVPTNGDADIKLKGTFVEQAKSNISLKKVPAGTYQLKMVVKLAKTTITELSDVFTVTAADPTPTTANTTNTSNTTTGNINSTSTAPVITAITSPIASVNAGVYIQGLRLLTTGTSTLTVGTTTTKIDRTYFTATGGTFVPANKGAKAPGTYDVYITNTNGQSNVVKLIINGPRAASFANPVDVFASVVSSLAANIVSSFDSMVDMLASVSGALQAPSAAITVGPDPIIGMVGTPTLKLLTDSTGRESVLVASSTLNIAAGTTGAFNIPLIGGIDMFILASTTSTNDVVYEDSSLTPNRPLATTTINNRVVYVIPAGEIVRFTINQRANPKRMPAGQYTAKVIQVTSLSSSGASQTIAVPANTTTKVTIKGLSVASISVTAPGKGDVLYRGTAYPISWMLNKYFGKLSVALVDTRTSNKYPILAVTNAGDTGLAAWTVPANVPVGDAYKIVVTAVGGTLTDDSALFSIRTQPGAQVAPVITSINDKTDNSAVVLSSGEVSIKGLRLTSAGSESVKVGGKILTYIKKFTDTEIVFIPSNNGIAASTTPYTVVVTTTDGVSNSSSFTVAAKLTTPTTPTTSLLPVISSITNTVGLNDNVNITGLRLTSATGNTLTLVNTATGVVSTTALNHDYFSATGGEFNAKNKGVTTADIYKVYITTSAGKSNEVYLTVTNGPDVSEATFTVSQQTLSFGQGVINQNVVKNLTIRNSGTAAGTVDIKLINSDGSFSITAINNKTFAVGEELVVPITFKAMTAGDKYGSLGLFKPGTNQQIYNVALLGTGVNQPVVTPSVTLRVNGGTTPVTVAYGTAVNLTWESTDTVSCTVPPVALNDGWLGTQTLNSSAPKSVYPNQTRTFDLNCLGTNGQTVSSSVTVNVTTPTPVTCGYGYTNINGSCILSQSQNPPTVTLIPSQTSITTNSIASVSIDRYATNATSCTASTDNDSVILWSGPVSNPNVGERKVVQINKTTKFSMTCQGGVGTTPVTNEITITIVPPTIPTVSLKANSQLETTINLGQSVTLTWTSNSSANCYASAFPGLAQWYGYVPASNTTGLVIQPTQTNSIMINCNGAVAGVRVTVIQPQAQPDVFMTIGSQESGISTSSLQVTSGGTIYLAYNSHNADSCTAESTDGRWSGSKPATALGTVIPLVVTQDAMYKITCTRPGAIPATTQVRVIIKTGIVIPDWPTVSLVPSADTVASGAQITLMWQATGVSASGGGCEASNYANNNQWTGSRGAIGSEQVTVFENTSNAAQTALFRLTCTNGSGTYVVSSAFITVLPASAN